MKSFPAKFINNICVHSWLTPKMNSPSDVKISWIKKKKNCKTMLVVQWLRPCIPKARDMGSISDQGRSHLRPCHKKQNKTKNIIAGCERDQGKHRTYSAAQDLVQYLEQHFLWSEQGIWLFTLHCSLKSISWLMHLTPRFYIFCETDKMPN